MFRVYTKHDVETLVARVRAEYEEALKGQKEEAEALKAENRALAARVSELEAARGNVSEALTRAVEEGERIKKESARAAENGQKELALLIEKCRLMLKRLSEKYPDAADTRALEGFLRSLRKEDEETDGLDMDEVLSPRRPLDLGKLCKELGLMEDGE